MPNPADSVAPPAVTVAVCTRDRVEDLARCLDALEAIRYPALDLLVVDNAPATRDAERLVAGRPRVRYVREVRPGLDWARNRAIAEARGEIVAFTDDDVVVEPGWVDALVAAFGDDPGVGGVTGLVLPLELETPAQRLFESYRSFGRGERRFQAQVPRGTGPVAARYGATGSFGTGANMAFRRDLLVELDGFDPGLGAGTPTRGGDDLDIFFRVLKAGRTLVYEPAAVVRHRHRRAMYVLVGQIRDHGISFSSYVVRTASVYPDERPALAKLWLWWLAKVGYRLLRPKEGPRWAMRRLALAELGGLMVGLGRYRRAPVRALPAPLGAPEPI